ncbi:MAG: xanthine dehydrogenase family protein molybdopterin-binding subunit [Nitrososphaerota archaeon]
MDYIGTPVMKLSDPPLLTGYGKYTADITLAGSVYAAFVRSKYAHARIREIRTGKAMRVEGVVNVFTGSDFAEYPVLQPISPKPYRSYGAKEATIHPLAVEKARFVGEPVALILADSRYAAAEAASLVDIEYDVLPPIVDVEEALKPNSPKVYDHWDSNLFIRLPSEWGDVESAFGKAEHTLRDSVRIHRYTGQALEPRAYVADFDPLHQKLTFYASTQQPHPLRTILAETLKIPENQIRVVQPFVGGGFGLKIPVFQEEIAVAVASVKLRKPVKWVAERVEEFMTGGHARDQRHYFDVAFNRDGRILGMKVKVIADVGALFPTPGWGMPIVTTIHLPTVYKIENYRVELLEVVTNKNPLNAYRGYGKECSCFLMERMMDLVARRLGIDRAEVRLRNFIPPEDFPARISRYTVLDSGSYATVLRKALEIFEYDKWLNLKKEAEREGRYIGIGIAYELTPEGACIPGSFFLQYDAVHLKVSPTGKVSIYTGITSPGNGQETAIAQIVAENLGVKLEDVNVYQGDTDLCPYGLGNFSGRSIISAGSAALLASRELLEKMKKVAANILEVSPADIDVSNGWFYVRDTPDRGVSIRDVSFAIHKNPFDLGRNVEAGLEIVKYFKMPNVEHIPDPNGYTRIYTSFPNAAHVCAVEVDAETGQLKILKYVIVDDCGKVINPLIVEGQLQGGVAQGIGGALMEELVYSSDGQLLTTTFMDYPIPTTKDVPDIIVKHHETPSPYTPTGSKGVGESGIVGAPACIASAVEDALQTFGVRVLETPLRPSTIWKLIQEVRRK